MADGVAGVPKKNDRVRGIDGHDFNLVLGQGGLKSFEFGNTARPFDDSCMLVKLFGFYFLDRAALFETGNVGLEDYR